jgi:hypothetical protein
MFPKPCRCLFITISSKKYKIEMKEILLQGFQNLVGVYLFNTYKVKKRPCRKEDRLFEREFF